MTHIPRSHCVEEGGSLVAKELVLLFRSSESSHLGQTYSTTRVFACHFPALPWYCEEAL